MWSPCRRRCNTLCRLGMRRCTVGAAEGEEEGGERGERGKEEGQDCRGQGGRCKLQQCQYHGARTCEAPGPHCCSTLLCSCRKPLAAHADCIPKRARKLQCAKLGSTRMYMSAGHSRRTCGAGACMPACLPLALTWGAAAGQAGRAGPLGEAGGCMDRCRVRQRSRFKAFVLN